MKNKNKLSNANLDFFGDDIDKETYESYQAMERGGATLTKSQIIDDARAYVAGRKKMLGSVRDSKRRSAA